jgi:hypothetical protein
MSSDDYFEVGYHVDRYYELEEDLIEFLRYIPLELNNNIDKRTSIQSPYLADMLVRIGSNIDVFFRKLILTRYNEIDAEKRGRYLNFDDYKKLDNIFTKRNAKLSTCKVRIIQTEEDIIPFENWNNITPKWWKSYNHVKHEAIFEEANLDNVIQSLAALLLLISFNKHSPKLALYGYLNIPPGYKHDIILKRKKELYHNITTKLFISPVQS